MSTSGILIHIYIYNTILISYAKLQYKCYIGMFYTARRFMLKLTLQTRPIWKK